MKKALPQSLTWMRLLPQQLSWTTQNAPQWFQSQLDAAIPPSQSQRPGLIVFKSPPPDVNNHAAVIAINCPKSFARQLYTQGHSHIRRFAAIPSLANARWYVPLDSPSISSASFCLYTPTRFVARLKRLAIKIAAYARIPFWRRDTIVVAQKSPGPIEKSLASLFPQNKIRLALSSGAPEPARNRKTIAAILSTRGKVLGFAKLAGSELSNLIVRHEATILPALQSQNVLAPKLLLAQEIDGSFITVQSPLPGKSTTPQFSPAHHAFLHSLITTTTKPASQTSFVQRLPERFAALPFHASHLQSVYDQILPALSTGLTLPVTIVHGDFAPWNLRRRKSKIFAYDWEYAHLDALPLIDEIHFRLEVGANVHNWTPDQALANVSCDQSAEKLRLSPPQVRLLQIVYLLDILARLLSEGYPPSEEMIDWRLKILSRLSIPTKELAIA